MKGPKDLLGEGWEKLKTAPGRKQVNKYRVTERSNETNYM